MNMKEMPQNAPTESAFETGKRKFLQRAGAISLSLSLVACGGVKPESNKVQVDGSGERQGAKAFPQEKAGSPVAISAIEPRVANISQASPEAQIVAGKLSGRNDIVSENDTQSQEIIPNPKEDILIFLRDRDKLKLSIAKGGNLFLRHSTGEFSVQGIDKLSSGRDKLYMTLGDTDSIRLFSKSEGAVTDYYEFIQNGRYITINSAELANDPFVVENLLKKLKAFNANNLNTTKIKLRDEGGEGFDHLAETKKEIKNVVIECQEEYYIYDANVKEIIIPFDPSKPNDIKCGQAGSRNVPNQSEIATLPKDSIVHISNTIIQELITMKRDITYQVGSVKVVLKVAK